MQHLPFYFKFIYLSTEYFQSQLLDSLILSIVNALHFYFSIYLIFLLW